jgi:hypothetical protein
VALGFPRGSRTAAMARLRESEMPNLCFLSVEKNYTPKRHRVSRNPAQRVLDARNWERRVHRD